MSNAASFSFARILLFVALFLGLGNLSRTPAQDVTRLKDRELEQLLKSLTPVTISATDSELETLLKKRYNVAIERSRKIAAGTLEGRISIADLARAIDTMTTAGLELWSNPQDRVIVLERKVKFTRVVEEFQRARMRDGTGSAEDFDLAKYNHLTAEIQLLRARQALLAKKQ